MKSRNQIEGKYVGKYRRRHRRVGLCNDGFGLPYDKTGADFLATRKEMRQHKLNQSFIRRIQKGWAA